MPPPPLSADVRCAHRPGVRSRPAHPPPVLRQGAQHPAAPTAPPTAPPTPPFLSPRSHECSFPLLSPPPAAPTNNPTPRSNGYPPGAVLLPLSGYASRLPRRPPEGPVPSALRLGRRDFHRDGADTRTRPPQDTCGHVRESVTVSVSPCPLCPVRRRTLWWSTAPSQRRRARGGGAARAPPAAALRAAAPPRRLAVAGWLGVDGRCDGGRVSPGPRATPLVSARVRQVFADTFRRLSAAGIRPEARGPGRSHSIPLSRFPPLLSRLSRPAPPPPGALLSASSPGWRRIRQVVYPAVSVPERPRPPPARADVAALGAAGVQGVPPGAHPLSHPRARPPAHRTRRLPRRPRRAGTHTTRRGGALTRRKAQPADAAPRRREGAPQREPI